MNKKKYKSNSRPTITELDIAYNTITKETICSPIIPLEIVQVLTKYREDISQYIYDIYSENSWGYEVADEILKYGIDEKHVVGNYEDE